MGSITEMQMQEEFIFRSPHSGVVPVPENVTLPEFVLQNSESYADKVAFVEVGSRKAITHGQVARDTERFAKALRSLGVRKGHVVIVVLPNVAEYAIIALGIMAAGAVFSGANPAAHVSEIKKQAQSSDAKLIVTNGLNHEKAIGIGSFSGTATVTSAAAIRWLSKDGIGAVGRLLIGLKMMKEAKGSRILYNETYL